MENVDKFKLEKLQTAFHILFDLQDLFRDPETIPESLHTMFIYYIQGEENIIDDEVIASYLQIRRLLLETNELFNIINLDDEHKAYELMEIKSEWTRINQETKAIILENRKI